MFSFTKLNKFSFLYIVRYILVVLYRKKLVAIIYTCFKSKVSLRIVGIFNLRSKLNTSIGWDLYIDFISNLGHFIFILALIYLVSIFYLTLLWYMRFNFSRYINLWITDWIKFLFLEVILFWNLDIIVLSIV